MERVIRFAADPPGWEAVRETLRLVGESAQLRMIDGLPAFPDEVPERGWRELRVGLAAGMVTIRRGETTLTVVVWGNADDALRAGWDRLTWACASAGSGTIDTPDCPISAVEFASRAGISPA